MQKQWPNQSAWARSLPLELCVCLQELLSIGVSSSSTPDTADSCYIASLVNATYSLLQRYRRSVKSRDELQERLDIVCTFVPTCTICLSHLHQVVVSVGQTLSLLSFTCSHITLVLSFSPVVSMQTVQRSSQGLKTEELQHLQVCLIYFTWYLLVFVCCLNH